MNTLCALGDGFEKAGSDCYVLGGNQLIGVHERLYYFPDLVVVCGAMRVDHRDAIHNPAAIVEVLSPTTETDDRAEKFRDYKGIESLRHYLLIEQNRVAVTHYEKSDEGKWMVAGDYRDLTDTVNLTFGTDALSVSLAQIYRNVPFPEPGSEPTIQEPEPA